MQKIQDPASGHPYHFPDGDRHFTGKNRKGDAVHVDYQYDRLERAYHHITDYTVAVDAGAHVGLLTRKLAERFKTVYAFEPDPANFACLCENTRHLPNVLQVQAALGAEAGRVSLDRGDGTNSGDVCVRGGDEVPVVPLDSYELPDLGLIKIDVQGYERQVLEGARQLIQAFAPVMIVECEPPGNLRRRYHKGDRDEVAAFFGQKHWDVRLVETISADRIYVPGPNGARPYTKYAVQGDYHWRQHAPGTDMGGCIQDVVNYVNAQTHRDILDVGCGDGHCTSILRSAFGVDDNHTAIALARRRGVPCVQLSAFRLAALGRRWGAVSMFDVFEHLPCQPQALRAVAAVTDTLFILNPDPLGKHWHAHEFTEAELVEFVTARGWAVKYSKRYEMSERNKKTFLHLVKDD